MTEEKRRDLLRRRATAALLALPFALSMLGTAWAQAPGESGAALAGAPETSGKPAAAAAATASAAVPSSSIASWLGPAADPGGTRAALAARGVRYNLIYIGDLLGNPRGGARQGVIYGGRLDAQLDVDFGELAGLPGLTFHANAYGIHGQGLSRCCLENLLIASGIEALPSTRLYEFYFEQQFFGERVSVRAGQLAADTEFLFSRFPALFINSAFGWPAITGVNLPSGGPAYPLATPGVRLKVAVTDALTLRAAVFNGDPAGPGLRDPQERNRFGLNFRVGDPPLVLAEARYGYNEAPDAAGLPGNLKIGAWAHAGRFQDQRFADFPTPDGQGGLSVRDGPLGSAGATRDLRGNAGIYAILTQLLYRVPGSVDRGIGVFARVAGNPADRNLVASSLDLGITAKGMIPGRENDTFGIGYARAAISPRARAAAAFLPIGQGVPVSPSEDVFALTYQAAIAPGWTVQPDLQYILRPGANLPTGESPRKPAENALVLGVRTTIQY